MIQIMLGQKSGETIFARNSLAAREIIKIEPPFIFVTTLAKKRLMVMMSLFFFFKKKETKDDKLKKSN